MLNPSASDQRNVAEAWNARLYLTGLTASMLGDSAMTLAAAIWVKSLTGSNAAAALVSALIYAPSLLSPLAGALADRVRRGRLLLTTNLAMAGLLLLLLLVDGRGTTWLIYAVMLCYGAAFVLLDPAENALFSTMFEAERRARVNGLRLTLQEGCKLVAPAVGAGLFAALGGGAVALLDAATFCVAAIAISLLRVVEPVLRPPRRHWRAELSAGARWVWQAREVRALSAAAAVAMFGSGVGFAAQFAMVDALHRSPSYLGVFTTALGAGSIVAGLLSGRIVNRYGERRLAVLGLIDLTIGHLLLAVPWLPAALAGSFVRGFALPWVVIATITIVQRLTPQDLQGRAGAAVSFLLFAPQPLAQALGAAVIGDVPYWVVYAAVAGVGLLCAGALLRHSVTSPA